MAPLSLLGILSLILTATTVRAKVVLYTLDLTVGTVSPDGFSRQAYLINNQTPGPDIVAQQGDDLSIRIENNLNVGTTIHFHGISQEGSIWSDGVPGITQRMIQPGETFVANWTATEHGTYWYHAHSKEIYADGIRGMIVIHPSDEELEAGPWSHISNIPIEIAAMKNAHLNPKPVTIVDWTHWTSDEGLTQRNRTGLETICFDSVLVNGKGRVVCPTQETLQSLSSSRYSAKGCAWRAPFPDTPDVLNPDLCTNTTAPSDVIRVSPTDLFASFSIVNMGATWSFRVSVDDHPMWVYAADGQFHVPQQVDVLEIASGERYQVLVRLDKPLTGEYSIRVASASSAQFISGYSTLSYSPVEPPSSLARSDNPALDYGGNVLPGFSLLDPLSLAVYPPSLVPPREADVTIALDMVRLSNITWALNKSPMSPFLELQEPLLFETPNRTELNSDLLHYYPVGSVVDVVIVSHSVNPRHPIHKHGVKAWIIGNGSGDWTWSNVSDAQTSHPEWFNLETPSRRDGFFTLDATKGTRWMVIRYEVTHPGVVFFHCHIANHLYGGMAVAMLEGVSSDGDIEVSIPDYYTNFNYEQHSDCADA